MTPDPRAPTARRRLLPGHALWLAGAGCVAMLVCLPVLSLALIAAQGSPEFWPHLLRNVLPVALRETVLLLVGVGAMVAVIGTGTAWLVTAHDFPGRRLFEWALLLPLAVPTYIVAYAYLDILHPVGPVQGVIRGLLGYSSPREFRLPDVRSMWGCILLLGLVLYPYVYLTTRALFLTQAANLIEAARSLGTPRHRVFYRVALPMARPAIAVGISLALMETLNDIGASEFLGVRTMTVAVYSTWLNRSDMPGAAQLSLVMLAFVAGLVMLERHARRRQRYASAAQRPYPLAPVRLTGGRAALAVLACALPVLLGFVAPAIYLVDQAWARFRFAGISPRIWAEAWNTLSFAAMATVLVVAAGMVMAFAARLRPGAFTATASRLSTLGYALPGTVLAIGVLPVVLALDHGLDDLAQGVTGRGVGLLLMGSGAALVYAYAVRFMAIANGGLESGLSRIPTSLDHAARTLGQRPAGAFRLIHLPLSRAAIAAAALLVFVDCVKELPATLLLRPLNFETLATHLYGEAARGTYEEAAIAALIIVVIGMLPVALLARVGRRM